jgi:hypothetical protein
VMRPLIARGGVLGVALEPIGANDLVELIARRFPGHTFPPAFAELVARITGGTPLFVMSFLEDLVTREMLVERDGTWTLAAALDQVAAHRPDSVKQLIDIQLDRLEPTEQRALEAASLVGAVCSTSLVAAALQADAETVEETLESLARRNLFVRRSASEELADGTIDSRFALTHGLVQEVCAGRAAPVKQQRMHRAIAEALEKQHAGRETDVAVHIASHFDQAHVVQRAIHYYVIAAQQMANRRAGSDALAAYTRARTLLARLPETTEREQTELKLLLASGQLELTTRYGTPTLSSETFERTVALARRTGEPNALYSALSGLTLREMMLAHYDRTKAIALELAELERTAKIEPTLVAYGRTIAASQYAYRGETTLATNMFSDLVIEPMAQLSAGGPVISTALYGPAVRATLIHAWLGGLARIGGRPSAARGFAETGVQLGLKVGDSLSLGLAALSLTRVLMYQRAPLAELQAALDVLERHASAGPQLTFEASAFRLYIEGLRTPLTSAQADELAVGFRDRMATIPGSIGVLSLAAVAALSTDHPALACTLAKETLDFVETSGERMYTPMLRCNYGDLLAATDPAAALLAYRRAHADALAQEAVALALFASLRIVRATNAPDDRAALASELAQIKDSDELLDVVEARSLLATPS